MPGAPFLVQPPCVFLPRRVRFALVLQGGMGVLGQIQDVGFEPSCESRHSGVLAMQLQQSGKRGRNEMGSQHGWWSNSGMLINVAFPISYFDQLGVPRLAT